MLSFWGPGIVRVAGAIKSTISSANSLWWSGVLKIGWLVTWGRTARQILQKIIQRRIFWNMQDLLRYEDRRTLGMMFCTLPSLWRTEYPGSCHHQSPKGRSRVHSYSKDANSTNWHTKRIFDYMLHTDAITCIPSRGLTRPNNLDYLPPPQSVIPRNRIRQLNSRQLSFL